jgi:invasion protein IalB
MFRLAAQVLLCLCVWAGPVSAQRSNVLYERQHGGWTVICTKDPMNDAAQCRLRGIGRGSRPVVGGDSAQIVVVSANKSAKPAIVVAVPYLVMLQRGLMIRTDANAPLALQCTDIGKQQCIIQGGNRDRLLSEWGNARQVVIRTYLFSETGPDFFFNMNGFNEGFTDFLASVSRFVR